jgi:hypothetical protein
MSEYCTEFPSAAFDRWLTTPPEDRNPVEECDNCDGSGCPACPDDVFAGEEFEPDDEYWPEYEESEEYYRDEGYHDDFRDGEFW